MTDPKEHLIARYLAGDISTDEVQQLKQALADDSQTADALMSEAFLDVHLRELLSGSVLGAAVSEDPPRLSNSIARRSRASRWMTSALLLSTISGWAVAAYVVGQLGESQTDVRILQNRVSELEQAIARTTTTIAEGYVPEIHSMRGWLMALPNEGDTSTEGQTLLAGTTAPLDKRLWTCPWGAAEFRYNSGVSISAERNTTVTINETDKLRRLTLERGIVHMTNLSRTDKRPTEIECDLATVRLKHGQVAVQVDEHQTTVEAAVNQVKVFTVEDGTTRTFTVRRGEHLIIKPGEKAKVVQGMLKLGLENSNT